MDTLDSDGSPGPSLPVPSPSMGTPHSLLAAAPPGLLPFLGPQVRASCCRRGLSPGAARAEEGALPGLQAGRVRGRGPQEVSPPCLQKSPLPPVPRPGRGLQEGGWAWGGPRGQQAFMTQELGTGCWPPTQGHRGSAGLVGGPVPRRRQSLGPRVSAVCTGREGGQAGEPSRRGGHLDAACPRRPAGLQSREQHRGQRRPSRGARCPWASARSLPGAGRRGPWGGRQALQSRRHLPSGPCSARLAEGRAVPRDRALCSALLRRSPFSPLGFWGAPGFQVLAHGGGESGGILTWNDEGAQGGGKTFALGPALGEQPDFRTGSEAPGRKRQECKLAPSLNSEE